MLPGVTISRVRYRHALLTVYFFLTIDAPENSGLIAFGNTLAGIRHTKFYIHFLFLQVKVIGSSKVEGLFGKEKEPTSALT